jgi:hypothetical protein
MDRYEPDFAEAQRVQAFPRETQVPVMNRIEGSAEDPDGGLAGHWLPAAACRGVA